MQMILNELSAKFPAGSIESGKKLMDGLLGTYFHVRKIIHNDSILLDRDYRSFELSPNYRIEKWRNDPTVNKEVKRGFLALLNKSVIYNSEEFDEEQGSDFTTEFQYGEHSSKGCLLAYEMDGVAVSFLSSEHWKVSEIEGKYIELTDAGELKCSEVQIPNVSFPENITIFEGYYKKKQQDLRYTDIISGHDILNCAKNVFPNLIFCENAVRGCKKTVGVTEAGQVYKQLLKLQQAAETMGKGFDKNSLPKATLESGATLMQFAEEHTFLLPDKTAQLFSWHIRYTGGYAGRIFFHPVPNAGIIYIGHIGHKLPTVQFH